MHAPITRKERNNVKHSKIIHIVIILLGIIFCLIPAFHTNMWFDESYSVAIAEHGFLDIWQITGNDVHPALYYWMLHIVYLLLGNNILAFRLCSVVGLALLGILGYTHIRKDFGEKVGILFSALVFFFPTMLMYATEIRMYTWAMLFVTLMCIYAWRLYKGQTQWKHWVLFAITALAAAYTHYYGLVTAGVVNAMLCFYLVKKDWKAKTFSEQSKQFIWTAIAEILLYLPWIVFLVLQLSQVAGGFWIQGFRFPEDLKNFFLFQFTGNLGENYHIAPVVAWVYAICMVTIFIVYMVKHWKEEEAKPAKWALCIYASVIVAIAIISVCMRPILYPRYLLIITGPLLIAIAYAFSKIKNNYVQIILTVLMVEVAIYANVQLTTYNYDKTNHAPIDYLESKVEENDIFLCGNEGSGFVVFANFPDNAQYFLDAQHWNVEEAYKAYDNLTIIYDLETLDNYTGRIWVINAGTYGILEQIQERYGENIEVIEKQGFDTPYQQYRYTFALIEKEV